MRNKEPLFGFGLVAFLGVLFWAYLPGLSGPFIFDDFSNLDALAVFEDGLSWAAVRDYLFAGTAGPSGRPLSLLSFLLDDWAWPSNPWRFKYTNVLIHALNSLLLLAAMHRVMLVRKMESSLASWALLLFVTSYWALNPYQVSSVLYVVQRMALLSTACVLFGLWMYLAGRANIERSLHGLGLAQVFVAYAVGAGVGVFFKENAVLLVLLIPVFELTLFAGRPRPVQLWILLVVPLVVFTVAMGLQWPEFREQYLWFRDFSLAERLLTQMRALGYYLWRYLIPGVQYIGVFGDGLTKSTGILSPPATFFWLLLHGVLLALALAYRSKWPLAALAILFFYVSHSLESTIVPLELFFEHRNYLPSALLLAPLLALRPQKTLIVSCVLILGCLVVLLRLQSGFWGEEHKLRAILAAENPHSERAIQSLARYVLPHQGPEIALEVLEHYQDRAGLELEINRMVLRCVLGVDESEHVQRLLDSVNVYRGKSVMLIGGIARLIDELEENRCGVLSASDLAELIERFSKAYPRDAEALQAISIARAYLAFSEGNREIFRHSIHHALGLSANRELVLSACGELKHSSVADACACLEEFEYVFSDATKEETIVRALLGYGDLLRQRYREDRAGVCEVD